LLQVSAKSIGKVVVSLGFTTRKSHGRKCFSLTWDRLSRLQSLTSVVVPKLPKVPRANIEANLQVENKVPVKSPESPGSSCAPASLEDAGDYGDCGGTLETLCRTAPAKDGGTLGSLGTYPETGIEKEWEEWEV